jgi:DNA ligase (NAD+)
MDRATELEAKIASAAEAYYNGSSTISDAEYDAWCDELIVLNPDSIVLTSIGAEPSSEWTNVAHLAPMGSLNKIKTPEKMTDHINNKWEGEAVVVSEKLDGLSICAVYENDILIRAVLRGNGLIGEDILKNASEMKGVIQQIKGKFSGTIRGEIILTKTDHTTHFPTYANPRNAASGLCRRFDGEGSEHLTVLMYDVIPSDGTKFAAEDGKFAWLQQQGFKTPNFKLIGKADEVNQLWQEYQEKIRASLDYEIDGLVVAVADLPKQESLGFNNMRPRGKIAFKFANQFEETTIHSITWEPGATGRVNPVGHFSPVSLLGSTIEKATLHNADYIKQLQLGIGSRVAVCKAGEIIPRIERVIKAAEKIAEPPTHCPSCEASLRWDGAYLVCPNYDCFPQIVGRINKWITTLDVLEIGDGLIDKLVRDKLVNTPADLYKLTVEVLSKVERMGKKSAKNVFDSLWKTNPISLDLFLGGLSIPNIAKQTIRMLMAGGYDTLDKIREITVEQAEAIHGMGDAKAKCLVNGLKQYSTVIDELIANGVKVGSKKAKSNKFASMSFVFTGTMEHDRKELQAMAIENGGVCPSSVSKTTTHLVVADPSSGSSKIQKAEKYGTKVISEQDFLRMVND